MGIREKINDMHSRYMLVSDFLAGLSKMEEVEEYEAAQWLLSNNGELPEPYVIDIHGAGNYRRLQGQYIINYLYAIAFPKQSALDYVKKEQQDYYFNIEEIKRYLKINKIEFCEEVFISQSKKSFALDSIDIENSKHGTMDRWPWGNYENEYLNILSDAVFEFFEPRRNPDAKRDEVVDWIKERLVQAGLDGSDNIASTMFTIIKPADHNPRKRRD